MVKCSFCNKDIPKGTGFMYVYKTGKILYFCSQKCKKNQLKLKRVGKRTKWTEHVQEKKRQLKKKRAEEKSAKKEEPAQTKK